MKRLLIGLTKIVKLLFKKEKVLKATNEMKPVEMDKYIVGVDPFCQSYENWIKDYVQYKYKIVKNCWHKSPRNYYVWISDNGQLELNKYPYPDGINKLIGNLYTLYQQYYGN